MKKNKTMRLASLLLVLVLMSTCMISGTFAKYVTEASGSDSARVAKWGVELSIDAALFAKEYKTDATTETDQTVSVKSTDKVVAPGTDSTEEGCDTKFSITGSPEVAMKVKVDLTTASDVYLKKGTGYPDYTKVTGYDKDGKPTYGTFDLEADYYPVVWTLTQGDETLKSGKLSEIKTFLDTYNTTVSQCTYAPNQSVAANFVLSWAWAYAGNDKADTLLGNLAAGAPASVSNVASTNYSTAIAYGLTVTATQID